MQSTVQYGRNGIFDLTQTVPCTTRYTIYQHLMDYQGKGDHQQRAEFFQGWEADDSHQIKFFK